MRILVFGGTTEGRQLAEWLAARGTCDVVACCATEYGARLVPVGPRVTALGQRMSEAQVEDLMRTQGFACVVDATHPYATSITQSVAQAAGATGTSRLRLVREGEPTGPWLGAPDAWEAARMVAGMPGRVLLTTGSKDLPVFAAGIPDFADRAYVRVLPVVSALEQARELGLATSHVIAMQGPFSEELNRALIRQLGTAVLVTKASGRAGGFEEKIRAAMACGNRVVVIHRPVREDDGLDFAQTKRVLTERFGV